MGSDTACSCPALSVFGEGAGRAKPPLAKFPRQLCTQGAPGGPQGARLAAEAANAPSTTPALSKGRAAWKSGVPTRGGERRGGRRAAGSRLLPAEAATATAPRGAGPRELSLPGAGPRRPAARRRGRGPTGGSTRGAQFGGQESKAERGESRSDQTSLGMSC